METMNPWAPSSILVINRDQWLHAGNIKDLGLESCVLYDPKSKKLCPIGHFLVWRDVPLSELAGKTYYPDPFSLNLQEALVQVNDNEELTLSEREQLIVEIAEHFGFGVRFEG